MSASVWPATRNPTNGIAWKSTSARLSRICAMKMQNAPTRKAPTTAHVKKDTPEMDDIVCLFAIHTVSMVGSVFRQIRVNAEAATRAPLVRKI